MSPEYRPYRECEFWLGRAGSGKTWGCLAGIAAELEHAPRGPLLLLIAPEQSTAQLERRLATWPGVGAGFTRARVLSFNHLMREALLHTGAAQRPMIDEIGRVMLIRRALRRLRPRLQIFGTSGGQPGTAEVISDTLTEFERYGWHAGDLEERVRAFGPDLATAGLLIRKLADLALIWREYGGLLTAAGLTDATGRYTHAAEAIAAWPELKSCRIWVDGFAAFATQELVLLDALFEHAASGIIALCADAGQLAPTSGTRLRVGPERLFENILETYHLLDQRLQDRGWHTKLRPLPELDQPTRFEASPPLAHLEHGVLGRLRPRVCPAETWSAAPAAVELIEAADTRAELEAVARRIVTLCRRERTPPRGAAPPLLWREVAVLARDLMPYAAQLREVFAQFEIPFFLDRPRQIDGHPLARLLLSALAVLRSGFSGQTVIAHLKTGLAALDDLDTIARLENAILASDPEGNGWQRSLRHHAGLAEAWRLAAAPLRGLELDLKESLSPARALWRLIEACGAATRLEAWIAREREAGREEQAQLHEQAWEQTMAWLESLQTLGSAGEGFTGAEGLAELMETVEAALAATRARLIPPTLNQVTVGSVDRSRTPEVKVAFVIGMNEQNFPRAWNPDAILGDGERAQLVAGTRRLGPDTSAKRLHEHFLAYIALTRAAQRLVLTRPLIDADGSTPGASSYFLAVSEAFPLAARRLIGRGGRDEAESLPLRPEEWALQLTEAQARLTDRPGLVDLALWRAGNPLACAELNHVQRQRLELAARARRTGGRASLSPEIAAQWWGGKARLPATALETYARCPFRFYAERMLRLQERSEARLTVMDLGSIRHEILKAVFTELRGNAPTLDWGLIRIDGADAVVDRRLAGLAAGADLAPRLEASSLDQATLANLGRDVKLFIRALHAAGKRTRLEQIASEWELNREKPLRLEAEGIVFEVGGVIDRVDRLAGHARTYFVFDYKSNAMKFNLRRTAAGIDLQLLVYALALETAGGIDGEGPVRIGGIFYWPLGAPLPVACGVPEPDATVADEQWFAERRPSGIFEEDLWPALDRAVGPGEAALAFNFKLTQKKVPSYSGGDQWPPGSMQGWLTLGRERIGAALEGMARGNIAVEPYRNGAETACAHCAMTAVCRRLEPDGMQWRMLPKVDRKTLAAQFTSGGSGA